MGGNATAPPLLEQKSRLALKYTSLSGRDNRTKKYLCCLIIVNYVLAEIIRLTLEPTIEVMFRTSPIYES